MLGHVGIGFKEPRGRTKTQRFGLDSAPGCSLATGGGRTARRTGLHCVDLFEAFTGGSTRFDAWRTE